MQYVRILYTFKVHFHCEVANLLILPIKLSWPKSCFMPQYDTSALTRKEGIMFRGIKNKLLGAVIAGTLGLFLATPSQAVPIAADIVWVIDTSGSMGSDIAQVKARILEFNTAMIANGIDANYAVVRFGGSETLIQDLTDFATLSAPGPFMSLIANGGGTERGSNATLLGLNTVSFRAGSVHNFILITDEDDDGNKRAELDAALTADNALFNAIVNPGFGATLAHYGPLATGHGGALFDILAFRSNPDAFFDNFIKTKVKEIIDHGKVPEPGVLFLMGFGLMGMGIARRKARQ